LDVVGRNADYVAIAVLAGLGAWMVLHEDEDDSETVDRLAVGHGLAVLALGHSISLDELAIGFTIGLLHLSLWLAIVLIGMQAFLFAQLGLRLGARLNETFASARSRPPASPCSGSPCSSASRSSPSPAAERMSGVGLPWSPATDGLRNIIGRVNADGMATAWAITSTVASAPWASARCPGRVVHPGTTTTAP
jgi:hypothetical protein